MVAWWPCQHRLMMCFGAQIGEEAQYFVRLLASPQEPPISACRLEQSKAHHESPWLSARPQAGHCWCITTLHRRSIWKAQGCQAPLLHI